MMVHTVRNMEQNMGIICKHTEYLRTEMQAVKRGYQKFQNWKAHHMILKIHRCTSGLKAAEERVGELEDSQ